MHNSGQGSAESRPSSWASMHQRATNVTCRLMKRPSQRNPKHSSLPATGTAIATAPQAMVSHRHSLPVIHAPQADEQRQEHQGQQLSSCQRRASLRERFWSVSSANAFNEEDHERRVHLRNQQEQQLQQRPRESYTPRHAATDFSLQMSATRGSQHLSSHWEDDDEAGNNDYALFVERSEMMNEAGEAAAARGLLPGRTKSQKRRSLGRRIAEYVKPPREER